MDRRPYAKIQLVLELKGWRSTGGDYGMMNWSTDMPRWKQILFGLLIAIALATLFTATATYTFLSGLGPGVDDEDALVAMEIPEPEPDSRVHILILGLDDPLGQGSSTNPTRSDTMILATFDPLTNQSNLVFIPRDTRVRIPERPSREKINHAHAYGGVGRAIETVKDFLDVPIHYYVRVDFKAFKEIIDVIGGVTIEVSTHMKYEDPTQDLYIDIPPGTHLMDGEMALKFVRYRNGSDIDRIGRQQQFLNSLVSQMLKVENVVRIPSLAERVSANVDTNMQPSRIIGMARSVASLVAEDFDMHMIPGRADYIDGISYWIADEEETRALVEREVLGLVRDSEDPVSVAVYNGGGVSGAAAEVADRIEVLGYEVVRVEDADDIGDSRYEHTRVVSHSSSDADEIFVRTLKVLLGEDSEVSLFRGDRQASETGQDSTEDLSLYIGADYQGLVR